MDQTIKHITERLVNQLPEDAESYKLTDLHQNGFPRFVIKRIEVELHRNLAESIILPETEWADMESSAVQHAWEQFVNAIRAQARLPESYVYPVVETAISDILDILVQPRKNLPDIIFGASDMLDYDEVVQQMDMIVVYRHFASLIPRYMERKGYIELSKEQCRKLITQADEKLTARYTSLNWAQMLEPLFKLMGDRIDPNLLRLFFEDRDKPRLARRFDMMNESLNRSELIEELSTPDLPDDDEQNELFLQMSRKSKISTGWEGLVKPVDDDEEEQESEESAVAVPEEGELEKERQKKNKEEENVASLNTLYNEEPESSAEEEDVEEQEEIEDENEEQESALNQLFIEEDAEEGEETAEIFKSTEEDQEDTDQFETAPVDHQPNEVDEETGKYQKWEDHRVEIENEKDLEVEQPEPPQQEEKTVEDELPEKGGEGEEDEPMWLRFIDPEEQEELEKQEEEQQEYEASAGEENGFEEEPLIDLTDDEQEDTGYEQLQEMLSSDRERFVEGIFRGSEEAYEEALKEIASKDNWRSASQYIEKEIFKRNLVDMYSEVAVDFTDWLHSFFIETTNSN